MSPTFYTYIRASRSGTLYVGVTADLARGVHEHKQVLIPGVTSKYRVWRLVYCEQPTTWALRAIEKSSSSCGRG